MIPKSQRRSPCPVACALDILGDKWTLLVIRDLFLGKHHFDEFRASPEGIATSTLSARLAWLTSLGLIRRTGHATDRRRIAYALTERGISLNSLLTETARWGLENIPGTKVMPGGAVSIRAAIKTQPQPKR